MTTETTQEIRAKFQARFLPMLEPFMGVRDIRYYLSGFLIERAARGGVYIVASNGHIMAAVYDRDGVIEGEARIIIRRDTGLIAGAKRCVTRGDLKPQVLYENGRVTVAPDFGMQGTDMETFVMPGKALVEANYPDWRRVLPDFSKLEPGIKSAVVDSRYMAIFKGVSMGGMHNIRFWQSPNVDADGRKAGEGSSAIVVQHMACPEFVAAVMPVADHEKNRTHDSSQLNLFAA